MLRLHSEKYFSESATILHTMYCFIIILIFRFLSQVALIILIEENKKRLTQCQKKREINNNFRSWLNSRQHEFEARKWGHTDTAHLIVCTLTWERGGGHQLPRSGITVSKFHFNSNYFQLALSIHVMYLDFQIQF